jgi:hypothetical protein
LHPKPNHLIHSITNFYLHFFANSVNSNKGGLYKAHEAARLPFKESKAFEDITIKDLEKLLNFIKHFITSAEITTHFNKKEYFKPLTFKNLQTRLEFIKTIAKKNI